MQLAREEDVERLEQKQQQRQAKVTMTHGSEPAAVVESVKREAPKVGRNELCPCGSGRKYKACHLDGPGKIGSVVAAKALLHKLDAWLSQPNMQRAGDDVLREIGAQVPASDDGVDPEQRVTACRCVVQTEEQ